MNSFHHKKLLIVFFGCIIFLVHVSIIDSYGLTWDFHHHFYAGLHLLRQPIAKSLTNHLPFTTPDPRTSLELPFGPIMSIAPVTTYLLFYEKLKLLAFDNAYNIAIIFMGVAGIVILGLFLLEATDIVTAVMAMTFLSLYPRYFADIHNNMKDVPQAAAFALSLWFFWRLVNRRNLIHLVLASAAFMIAFNIKINALAIPVIAFGWFVFILLTKLKIHLVTPIKRIRFSTILPILLYFVLAPVLAILLWSLFFTNPFERIRYIPEFFQVNTYSLEVLYLGKIFCSGINIPWHYPLGFLAITTPIPILIFFFIGLIGLIRQIRQKPIASLLILWFIVPLLRFLYSKVGVLDGIRHFEEVVYPLSAIAAVGFMTVLRVTGVGGPPRRGPLVGILGGKRLAGPAVLLAIFLVGILIKINWDYHPFQIAYYNELVGGIKGAYGTYDLDYWGTSQKAAIHWINTYVPKNSTVNIVMAGDVASKYLRPDLLERVNTSYYDQSDYLVVLNRQSFFYRYYITPYLLTHKPMYSVNLQGVPLVWIFDNHRGKEPVSQWWTASDPCVH